MGGGGGGGGGELCDVPIGQVNIGLLYMRLKREDKLEYEANQSLPHISLGMRLINLYPTSAWE